TFFSQFSPVDSTGRRFTLVPRGLEQSRISLPREYVSGRIQVAPDKPLDNRRQIDFETINDDITGVKIVRYEPPVVRVHLVNEQDEPVEGAYILIETPAEKHEGNAAAQPKSKAKPIYWDCTDVKDGLYVSRCLVPDQELTFMIAAPGY